MSTTLDRPTIDAPVIPDRPPQPPAPPPFEVTDRMKRVAAYLGIDIPKSPEHAKYQERVLEAVVQSRTAYNCSGARSAVW